MSEFWLDVGAGIEAEHWAATPAPPGVRQVAVDPLLSSGMIASGRLPRLPDGVLRVGAEVRPSGSVEKERSRSYLPFRDRVFAHVHCAFLLHLYLELLELVAEETHRVLRPGGTLTVLLPHLGDLRCEQLLHRTEQVLSRHYGAAQLTRYGGPFTTFWADLHRDRTYAIWCVRRAR